MSTALEILKGFNNSTLQAMTDDQLQTAINLAFLEIHKPTYKTLANPAAANLAAHNILMEANAGSGGRQVSRKKVGPREEEYFSGGSTGGEDFNRTIFGVRFMRYRDQVTVGFASSAHCS